MASALRFFLRACTSTLLLWHLAGCGNAYESLDVGEWESAEGTTAPADAGVPLSSEIFRVTTLDPGQKREIRAGSLVQIRITARSGLLKDAATGRPVQHATAWLWTGNAPAAGKRISSNFGLAQLRASLVGLKQGARISVFADPRRAGLILSLPARGYLLPFSYRPDWRQWVPAGDAAASLDKEYTELAQKGDYEVEILRVCDGRLFRKQAVLKQWGVIFNWGDMDYRFARRGGLEWLAIEADCEAPNEKVRFEKGPAYGIRSPGYRETTLWMWQASYEAAR